MPKKKLPERLVKQNSPEIVAQAELPTRYGRFTIHGFRGNGPQDEAVALVDRSAVRDLAKRDGFWKGAVPGARHRVGWRSAAEVL